ncbi:hypothetical protein [Lentibacillus jeotgali]
MISFGTLIIAILSNQKNNHPVSLTSVGWSFF